MTEMLAWLRGVIEGDRAYAEADFEWELVKAKGGLQRDDHTSRSRVGNR